jgi:hypothetical protein
MIQYSLLGRTAASTLLNTTFRGLAPSPSSGKTDLTYTGQTSCMLNQFCLRMGTELVPETLYWNELTRLCAREDYIETVLFGRQDDQCMLTVLFGWQDDQCMLTVLFGRQDDQCMLTVLFGRQDDQCMLNFKAVLVACFQTLFRNFQGIITHWVYPMSQRNFEAYIFR